MKKWSEFVKDGHKPASESAEIGSTELLRSMLPTLVEESSDGVVIARILGDNGPLIFVNRAFEQLTGYDRRDVLGKDCRYLQGSEREQPEVSQIREAIRKAQPVDVILRNYRKNGSAFWNSLSLRPFHIDHDLHYLGVLRDVSAARETELALNRAANLDATTGCLNRQTFVQEAEKRLGRHSGQALIVMFDIIGFHDINAGYGFDVGDALLSETGNRLRKSGADLVARFGANEFAAVFMLAGGVNGQDIVAEVYSALSSEFKIPGARISLRFAMGYALREESGSANGLIRNASSALRAAKSDPLSGPHQFQQADEEEACRRVRMTSELKTAIENNELVYHFQPQIEFSSGEWVGAEALIRWNHPLFGCLPPGRFVEAAERTGLLLEVGERGLSRVAAFARRINAERERPLHFSVNVSAVEFLHRDMAELLDRITRQVGANPAWFTLEITESVLLTDSPAVLEAFRKLRDLGARISIDDFGTGYSSLRLLETFPVDEIKIDRSFVAKLGVSTSKTIIVRAIIDLGRALNLTVVAEGVETESQRAMLAGMGCTIGQGYLFAVPMDTENFAAGVPSRQRA